MIAHVAQGLAVDKGRVIPMGRAYAANIPLLSRRWNSCLLSG